MSKAVYRTYGTESYRGQHLQLGEGKKVKFSDTLPAPFFGRIRIVDEHGVDDEKGIELYRLLERTNAFAKGEVFYVPSPDELKEKRKKEAQEAEVLRIKDMLASGLFTLDLDSKDVHELRKLAESIGARTKDKNGKHISNMVQKNAIYGKLGINPFQKNEKVSAESIDAPRPKTVKEGAEPKPKKELKEKKD